MSMLGLMSHEGQYYLTHSQHSTNLHILFFSDSYVKIFTTWHQMEW